MSEYSLKGVVWGSDEFIDIMTKVKRDEIVSEELRSIDEALSKITTDEGWNYLIGRTIG